MTTLTEYSQQRGYALAQLQVQLQALRPQLESGVTDSCLLDNINKCVDDLIETTAHIEQIQNQTSCWVRHPYIRVCIRAIKWGVPSLLILDTVGDGIDTYFERIEYEQCATTHRNYADQYLTGLNNTVSFPPLERLCPSGSDLKLALLVVKIVATAGSIFGAWAINEYENASTAHNNQLMQLRNARDSDNKFRLFLAALASFHNNPTKEHLHECADAMDDAPGNANFEALGTREQLLSHLLPNVQDADVRAELDSLRHQIESHLEFRKSHQRRRYSSKRAATTTTTTTTTGGGSAARRTRRQHHGERGEGNEIPATISLDNLKQVTGLQNLSRLKIGDWWIGKNGSIAPTEEEISHSSDSERHPVNLLPRPVISVGTDATV